MTPSAEAPAVAVLVPVKRLDEAKSRLRELGEAACRALVLAMLEDVLDAVREAAVGPLVLLSSDDAYDELAGRYGATRVADAAPSYSGAVAGGLELAAVLEVGRALVLPADLPALRAADVRELARALEAAEVVLAPSDDGGTSALGLRPPGAMAPAFGLESAAAHRRGAAAAGLRLEERALPNLAVDVDTPSDLRAVASRVGPATARALQAFGLG